MHVNIFIAEQAGSKAVCNVFAKLLKIVGNCNRCNGGDIYVRTSGEALLRDLEELSPFQTASCNNKGLTFLLSLDFTAALLAMSLCASQWTSSRSLSAAVRALAQPLDVHLFG